MHWGGWAGQVPLKARRLLPTWSPCLQGLGRGLGSVCSQRQVSPFWSRHRELPQERMEMFQDGEEAWPLFPWLFGPKSAQRKLLLVHQQVALEDSIDIFGLGLWREPNKPPNPLPLSQRTASWKKEKRGIR